MLHAWAIIGAAAALLAPGSARVEQLTISLESHSYTPRTVQLRAGQPVSLTFVNRAGKGHDFTAHAFFKTSRIIAGTIDDGQVELPAGASRTITLVPAAGRYTVHCGHFMHKQLGMTGEIIVR